jgi:hypothetical protein
LINEKVLGAPPWEPTRFDLQYQFGIISFRMLSDRGGECYETSEMSRVKKPLFMPRMVG